MAHRLKFIILTRFVLLRLQSRDAVLTRADIELEFFAFDLELSCPLLERLERSGIGRQLSFKVFSLLRKRLNLELNLPDLLIPVLQDQIREIFRDAVDGGGPGTACTRERYRRRRTASIVGDSVQFHR